jgi:hypothetical protein
MHRMTHVFDLKKWTRYINHFKNLKNKNILILKLEGILTIVLTIANPSNRTHK